MLLQRLGEYAGRMKDVLPTLYSQGTVRYIIELDEHGVLLSATVTDAGEPDKRGKVHGLRRPVPQIQRANTIRPLLLADNAEYTFGLVKEGSKQARTADCHASYMDLLARCAVRTADPTVQAVQCFLQEDPTAKLALREDFDRSATLTFSVNGTFPIDLPSVQAFWAAENDPGAVEDGPVRVMQCLICGNNRPVLARLQAKIKGVPGGQTAGTSLISANENAFESYGLENSLIAPTCAECGERFTRAINDLLKGEHSRITVGGAAFLFWTREPQAEFSWLNMVSKPEAGEVQTLLRSVRIGTKPDDLDATAFYGIALSGSGGRVVVRDWIDTTVGEAKYHLAEWFERQQIVDLDGSPGRPYGLTALAGGTVRELNDLSPQTPRQLLRSALTGVALPVGLLYQALRRNRAEQGVTRQRAALIKLVLRSHEREGADKMISLDQENPEPAYRCGRLFAVLEEVQRLAVPGIKATIGSRFYGAASSAPISVFSRLLQGARPHLAKLERDRPGAFRALQRRLEDIMGGLNGFPRMLTLEQQGLFSLGYYHQRAYDREQAHLASERRRDSNADVMHDLEPSIEPDDL